MFQRGNGSLDPGQGPFQCPGLPWGCYSAQHWIQRSSGRQGKHTQMATRVAGHWEVLRNREGGTSHTHRQIFTCQRFGLSFSPKKDCHRGIPLAEAHAHLQLAILTKVFIGHTHCLSQPPLPAALGDRHAPPILQMSKQALRVPEDSRPGHPLSMMGEANHSLR